MRILRCIHSANPKGGGPIANILGMQAPLEAQGHEVELASLDAPDALFLQETNIKMHGLGPGRGSFGYSSRWKSWMRSNLDQFDRIIIHGLWQYPHFSIPSLANKKKIPYYIYPHGMLDPWFNQRYPLKRIKKQIFWWIAGHRNLARAQAVFFTSEEEKVRSRNTFWPYQFQEQVIAYGIPGNPFPAQNLNHPLKGRPFLLFLGRIHEKKGIDLLLEAYRHWDGNKELDLVIAGPGELPALDSEIQKKVHLPGMVEGKQKWALLTHAEAFVLPSHQENFGVAVAESLSAGTPVLISDQVNIYREVEAASAGLVAPDTHSGTANLLQRWGKLAPNEKKSMRDNAIRLFHRQFEVSRAAEDLELLKSVSV